MGPTRSYRRLAEKHGVGVRTVEEAARAGDWAKRTELVDVRASEAAIKAAERSVEEIKAAILKDCAKIREKAIGALEDQDFDGAKEATDALLAIGKQELLVIGEATERTEMGVQAIIRREYEDWLEPPAPRVIDAQVEAELIEMQAEPAPAPCEPGVEAVLGERRRALEGEPVAADPETDVEPEETPAADPGLTVFDGDVRETAV